MSQASLVIENGTGLAVRARINNALQAVNSNFRGPGEPYPAYAGMMWQDTTNMLVKQRNANNNGWITVGKLDAVNWGLLPSSEVVAAPAANKVLRMNNDGELPANVTGSSSSCTGNAATATKLKTAVKINETPFDGTEDITIEKAVSPGLIGHFACINPPTGWLKANGAAVSRATYAGLFAAIGTTFGTGDGSTTFNLPDLRGDFVRGLDDGRGADSGRALGSWQADAFQGHHHYLWSGRNDDGGFHAQGWSIPHVGDYFTANNFQNSIDHVRTARTDGVNGQPRISAETRPRNVALLACIKY